MSLNSMMQFWRRQSETAPLTAEQVEAIRDEFSVSENVRIVEKAPGYAISESGRVFSGLVCSHNKQCPREMKPIRTSAGYLMVRLYINRKSSADLIHRLIAFAFLKPPDAGQTVVRHLDGDQLNNHFSNLAWGTQADNLADAIRHGKTLRGLKNPNAKLTNNRAKIIRDLSEEGFSPSIIGSLFGVDRETVRRIVTGTSWKDDAPQ